MDSSIICLQLKKSLHSTQIFIIFGTVAILLLLAFIPIIEAKNSPDVGVLAVRIPLYGIVLPYFIWYYLYRPVMDIRQIDMFFIDVECINGNYTGKLISNKAVVACENGASKAIILAGIKYDCRIYINNDEEYYYPTAITKKGFKIS